MKIELSKSYENTPEDFIKEYFISANLADQSVAHDQLSISDIDMDKPLISYPYVKLGSKTIIRSRSNRNLEA